MGDAHEYPGLEVLAHQLLAELKERKFVPPDVGVSIFLYHYGQGGGLAYVSSGDRAGMIDTVTEWLARQGERGYHEEVLKAFAKHFKPGER